MSVYARVRVCVRVGIRVSSLHFVSMSQVGNERFREFEKKRVTDGRTDRWRDGPTDGGTEGWTDGRTDELTLI